MEPIIEAEDLATNDATSAPRPRLRDYIWRPRIAKIWWAGSLVWWAGFVAAQGNGWLSEYYQSAIAGYLNVLFYPMTIIMALGVPFAWAKLDRGDRAMKPPAHDEMFPPLSVGGMIDPASDPLDPRSGLHWQHFHRDN